MAIDLQVGQAAASIAAARADGPAPGIRAFFDEPTVHLDEERRDTLVGRLMSLPYFTQLFVISHDDTFERATDHVVHVEKKDGQSVVRMS